MPDLSTTFKFALSVDNVNIGYFRKCAGIESETEITSTILSSHQLWSVVKVIPACSCWTSQAA